ncbi:protease [Catellatospora sp. IY07-71]|uniref:immune inhibitor A domain-containing protein n=1 Tax=Catellatospora sp. IY07-71 TaxID=2728827 RepID=UPI001BB702D2|nr:immune inhibitor A domain-containing protein [Catellatospora sp. IY07-71]BCJ72106.1 protease [Catellatospora sp. IY07-71]
MRIRRIGTAAGIAAALVAASLTATPASGAPARAVTPQDPTGVSRPDNLPNPLNAKRQETLKKAIADVVSGKAKPIQRNGSEVVQVAKGRWAELKKKADKVDPIFTILVEFGDQVGPDGTGGTPGPSYNQIPQPDRTKDNSTYWVSNFDKAHYLKMINGPGESMADFYYKQSGGKYSVKGDVSDWVKLQYNEARYGYNWDEAEQNPNELDDRHTYWPFIEDTATEWYNSQLAAGKTKAEIKAYLTQFDIWDRYDADGDGNFNEPDGYIDHFQAIHAGEGEEAGGGAQGADAIWSHRWYVNSTDEGKTGPEGNKLGGAPIGDSGIWIGDYTTEPENGGLGVFTHEYGHDLGLPDLYDTQGGDNSTAFWTLMSGGSWLSKDPNSIGTSPSYMGPWEKLFLGWLDYTVVDPGKTKLVSLGSAATPEGLPQAVLVPLPDQTVTENWNTPYSGGWEWWSGSADDLNVSLERTVDLTDATTATLTAKAQYRIEPGYDWLYGEVSTDGGTTWTKVQEPGIGGQSAGWPTGWVDLNYDLTPWKGQTVKFRFHYTSDGGLHYEGAFLDDIKLVTDGTHGFTDDVEAGVGGWTAKGFERINGSTTDVYPRFYLAEYRTYTGYDKNFKTGPYNFGFASKPDWVEKFPYQDGLLVWYVNYKYGDNNTRVHPGGGLALPVDARPTPIAWPGTCAAHAGNPDGLCMLGNRRQPFDAVFGLQKTDAVTFHRADVPLTVPSSKGIATFDDTDPNRYWSPQNPWGSVQVAGDGVKISVWLEFTGVAPVMLLQVKN